MNEEIWKPVPNYEGLYEVSNLGNVKSLNYRRKKTHHLLKVNVNNRGYSVVGLYNNKKLKLFVVHQLVAMAFLNHIPRVDNLVVNHINLNKKDNRLKNLEVTTQRENSNHKHIESSSIYTGVSWASNINKWKAQIFINGKNNYLGIFTNEYDAHLAYEKALCKHLNVKL